MADYFDLHRIVSIILLIIPLTCWILGVATRFKEQKYVAAIVRIFFGFNIIGKSGIILGTCEITVLQHVTGISLSSSEIELNRIGETFKLEVNVSLDNASNKKVNWITSNLGICHIAADGTVTATGFGTAVVFATSEDGEFTASCTVHVIDTSSILECQNTSNNIKLNQYYRCHNFSSI